VDETNELIRRNGMATVQSCYLMAQTLKQIGDLFAVANQPLPEPHKAPLVGETALSENEKTILDFVAELGTVQAHTVEMNIALPSQEVSRVLTLLAQYRLVESFSDASKITWYRLLVESAPASGKRHTDASWMPDEPTTVELDGVPDAGRAPTQSESRPADERREASEPIASHGYAFRDESPTIESVEGPKIGTRTKNEFTAREWRNSKHFLQYMKQPEFSPWNAETQRIKGDEFVEAIDRLSPELKMNRWGDRFKKFHGFK